MLIVLSLDAFKKKREEEGGREGGKEGQEMKYLGMVIHALRRWR